MNNIKFRFALSLVVFLNFFSCFSYNAESEETTVESATLIDSDNPYIQYIGRFSHVDPKKAVFDWPGVMIFAKFEGTSCSIRLNDCKNFYTVIIDKRPSFVLKTDTNTIYNVAKGLSDSEVHTIMIQKRTETFIGKGEFLGFVLDKEKKLLPPDERPGRRIEFIGDSITCGYGVEGESPKCKFSAETENASMSYASVTARALNADYFLVAYSGRGVVRNYGDKNNTSPEPMPSMYDRTCCFDSTMKWDFSSWIPQAVVINLGSNDFSTEPRAEKPVFQDAYTSLINRVLTQYKGVNIFCVSSPSIWQPGVGYIKEIVDQFKKNGHDTDVHFIEIPKSIMTSSDWGSDWHPNVQGQNKIAEVLIPFIKSKMNW